MTKRPKTGTNPNPDIPQKPDETQKTVKRRSTEGKPRTDEQKPTKQVKIPRYTWRETLRKIAQDDGLIQTFICGDIEERPRRQVNLSPKEAEDLHRNGYVAQWFLDGINLLESETAREVINVVYKKPSVAHIRFFAAKFKNSDEIDLLALSSSYHQSPDKPGFYDINPFALTLTDERGMTGRSCIPELPRDAHSNLELTSLPFRDEVKTRIQDKTYPEGGKIVKFLHRLYFFMCRFEPRIRHMASKNDKSYAEEAGKHKYYMHIPKRSPTFDTSRVSSSPSLTSSANAFALSAAPISLAPKASSSTLVTQATSAASMAVSSAAPPKGRGDVMSISNLLSQNMGGDPEKPGDTRGDPEKSGDTRGDPEKPGDTRGDPEKPGDPGSERLTNKRKRSSELLREQPVSFSLKRHTAAFASIVPSSANS